MSGFEIWCYFKIYPKQSTLCGAHRLLGEGRAGGEDAVVDTELRVRGLENLRVIDASIMPKLISGNTQAPSIMVGEKGAAIMRAGKLV